MIPITSEDGLTAWATRPPPQCPRGHPFRPGDGARSYAESWFACWCERAQSDHGRPGHRSYTCKRCAEVTLVPPCTDPAQKVGWAASHGH
jgi:hypothetical protein